MAENQTAGLEVNVEFEALLAAARAMTLAAGAADKLGSAGEEAGDGLKEAGEEARKTDRNLLGMRRSTITAKSALEAMERSANLLKTGMEAIGKAVAFGRDQFNAYLETDAQAAAQSEDTASKFGELRASLINSIVPAGSLSTFIGRLGNVFGALSTHIKESSGEAGDSGDVLNRNLLPALLAINRAVQFMRDGVAGMRVVWAALKATIETIVQLLMASVATSFELVIRYANLMVRSLTDLASIVPGMDAVADRGRAIGASLDEATEFLAGFRRTLGRGIVESWGNVADAVDTATDSIQRNEEQARSVAEVLTAAANAGVDLADTGGGGGGGGRPPAASGPAVETPEERELRAARTARETLKNERRAAAEEVMANSARMLEAAKAQADLLNQQRENQLLKEQELAELAAEREAELQEARQSRAEAHAAIMGGLLEGQLAHTAALLGADAEARKKALKQMGADAISAAANAAVVELGIKAAAAFGSGNFIAGAGLLAAIGTVKGLAAAAGAAVTGGGGSKKAAKPATARDTTPQAQSSTTNVVTNNFGIVGDPRGAARMIGEQVRTGGQYGLSPATR